MTSDLTIITSFFRDSGHLIRNMNNVRDFNPNGQHKWILVDNSSGGTDFDLVKNETFVLYKGVNEQLIRPFFLKQISAANAVSVNFGITKSDTRFICIMDPDFFVIYPNWIEAVLSYMDTAGVGILSAPYHPIWYQKAHKATGHFMVIDTEAVPKSMLDFTPGLKDFYRDDRRIFRRLLGDRRNTGRFYDCGSQIEELFGHEIEYLVPLIDTKTFSIADKIIDRFLPKKWQKTYVDYPVILAKISGILSVAEGYYWRGYPFAIHLRRYGQMVLGRNVGDLDQSINAVLDQIHAGYKNILEA